MQLRIYSVDHLSQMFRIIYQIQVIHIQDYQISFIIAVDPRFVPFVQSAEVIYTDGSFIIATSFMDLVNKIWDAASKIDQEVWTFGHAFHQFKKRAVIFKITI